MSVKLWIKIKQESEEIHSFNQMSAYSIFLIFHVKVSERDRIIKPVKEQSKFVVIVPTSTMWDPPEFRLLKFEYHEPM